MSDNYFCGQPTEKYVIYNSGNVTCEIEEGDAKTGPVKLLFTNKSNEDIEKVFVVSEKLIVTGMSLGGTEEILQASEIRIVIKVGEEIIVTSLERTNPFKMSQFLLCIKTILPIFAALKIVRT